MAKDSQAQKGQIDTEDEMLDFDLEELVGDEGSDEDEVIELVELVEAEQDGDKTGELALKRRFSEEPAVLLAEPSAADEGAAIGPAKDSPPDEEGADLDLSDLSLDMDVETGRPAPGFGANDINEADLENLLKETSDEELTFDLSGDEESALAGKEEEVTDADLEALLQEATAEGLEEAKEEGEVLEIVSEAEAVEQVAQVQLEEAKPSLTEIESVAESLEETQAVTEPSVEQAAPTSGPAQPEVPIALGPPQQKEQLAREEPPVEKPAGITEERLEEIITKVVQDVVERVARETMVSVAERVIGQAIEALKASLETSSEER